MLFSPDLGLNRQVEVGKVEVRRETVGRDQIVRTPERSENPSGRRFGEER